MEKVKYHLIWGALSLVALLPLSVLYVISDFMYFVLYKIIGYRKKTVRDNLLKSFPNRSLEEIKDIERKFFHHLSDCIVETIKLVHISDEEINRRVLVTNPELIEELASDGRPIILYMGHYGNWEWVQAVTSHYKRPAINCEIYRPLHDKVMDKIFLRIRSRFPNMAIPQNQAFRSLLRMKQEGKQVLVGFIADQRPNSKNLNHWTTFLHQDTAYAVGGEEIGNRMNGHYAYLEVEKYKRGHFRMTFKKIPLPQEELEYPYTLQFMKMLEETIERAPEYWLWSHKRWRFSRPENLKK
ncbi:MAG: lysophospholipid acyltransferase family protein [Bacteroidaceae bacterium]|nr:lysophospholipid acyltransferase family protein [Bacteroidaceae bacterium]